MTSTQDWNWNTDKKLVADIGALRSEFEDVHEFVASPDGERIAVPVVKGEDEMGVSVNGQLLEGEFERAWKLTYTPDGRLVSLVRIDDEWTVAVDGVPWEETYDFAWNIKFSEDGSVIAVQVKQEPKYTVAINGKTCENTFLAMRDYVLSDDGKKFAATVQVETLAEGDIFKFLEGTWSVAVDGEAWAKKYMNVYGPRFSPDGSRVAVEIRTDIAEYTLAENDTPWENKFGCIWEPLYRPDGSLVVPVKTPTGWTLAENGNVLWKGRYVQIWNQKVSPDGKRVAAVAAPSYGQWTIVVDDVPWKCTFNDMVLPPIFSLDGSRVAAIVKNDNRWGIAVDGSAWAQTFDMVWDPVFSPDGSTVAAKVDKNGKYAIAVNGKLWSPEFEALWDPAFSPDGNKVLVRGVVDGKYYRQIVSLTEMI
ncbi:MAG: WD40 repeat domain-containing protein [Deltaproteobacteria bacterium]|nr:WD40 repeat domain-containing protein [Deltaproteobacteria bacterium]